jgi:guanylate kinase
VTGRQKIPQLLIFSAPSGGGKTSLAQAIANDCPHVVVSISHTTRSPRRGEVDGVDYFFVSPVVFEQMIERGEFLEYARVFDHYYGTSRSSVDRALAAKQTVILDIDWQGARKVRASNSDAVSVFILPPSIEALQKRLAQRGRDNRDQIDYRMQRAITEMRHYVEYDHIVINDRFDDTVTELKQLVLHQQPPTSAAGLDLAALVNSAENVKLKTSETPYS